MTQIKREPSRWDTEIIIIKKKKKPEEVTQKKEDDGYEQVTSGKGSIL